MSKMFTVRLLSRKSPGISRSFGWAVRRLAVPAAMIAAAFFPVPPFAQVGTDDLDLGGGGTESTPPETPADPYGIEDDEAFRALGESRDIAKLRQFLSRFPDSTYASTVGERINYLLAEKVAAERLAQCNGVRWQQVRDSCNVSEQEDFVSECGESIYLNRVRNRLHGIEIGIICIAERAPAPAPEPSPDRVIGSFITDRYPAAKTMVAKDEQNINIRRGPSKDYEKAGDLRAAESIQVLGEVRGKNWLLVRHRGGEAYIAAWLMTEVPDRLQPPSEEPMPTPLEEYDIVTVNAVTSGCIVSDDTRIRLKSGDKLIYYEELEGGIAIVDVALVSGERKMAKVSAELLLFLGPGSGIPVSLPDRIEEPGRVGTLFCGERQAGLPGTSSPESAATRSEDRATNWLNRFGGGAADASSGTGASGGTGAGGGGGGGGSSGSNKETRRHGSSPGRTVE